MIVNQYIQTNMFASNASNHMVKQTENLPYISSRGRADGGLRKNYNNQPKNMQNKGDNPDVLFMRPKNKNYMEAKNIRIEGPPMSVLESEIDGGITRIGMNKRM